MHSDDIRIRRHRFDRATTRTGPSLDIDVEQRPNSPVLASVTGDVDALAAPLLLECVDRHLRDRNGMVLDLGQVNFLAVSGLSVLMDAERRAERDHLDWAVVVAGRPVTRPLEASGLMDELPAYDSVPEAVAAVSAAVRAHSGR